MKCLNMLELKIISYVTCKGGVRFAIHLNGKTFLKLGPVGKPNSCDIQN